MTLQERAQQLRHKLINTCFVRYDENHRRGLAPPEADDQRKNFEPLLAQVEAQARLSEAEWWMQKFHFIHSEDCMFDKTDSPEGDFCICNLTNRRGEALKRLTQLRQQAGAEGEKEGEKR